MYPHQLTNSLVNARIDDLRRSMAASRGGHRHRFAASYSDSGPRRPRRGTPRISIRALTVRFAH
jgi:hypothetical protein